jgi:hypothetical protein
MKRPMERTASMFGICPNLEISDVSLVKRGADDGFEIVITKSHSENNNISDKSQIDPNDTPTPLSPKLNEFAATMIMAATASPKKRRFIICCMLPMAGSWPNI